MISAIIATSLGGTTQVTATSSLSGIVYFFWYQDGTYVGMSSSSSGHSSRSFVLQSTQQSQIDVLDSNSASFDPIANAPAVHPASRTLQFVRSTSRTVSRYRIDQNAADSGWQTLAFVADDPRRWDFQVVAASLEDLTNYAWRVVPLDAAGGEGTAVSLADELIVRRPDAPDFSISFNADTQKVSFAS